ncbi:Lipid transfer protein/Par allergen [Parasponia andersonii]|uniref:Non-specific lipid-transfer protein n=1 Tax=Parasponia andersonii TaxID=3476 RepID=A0A2P5C5S7_PARAD|nr:Lipid transfer protein/Par allergen [Parasponia andersonii]
MKKGTSVAAALLVLAMMVSFMAKPGQAITCQQVDVALSSCVSYLTGSTAEPSQGCCNGVSSIKQNTPTKTDRQTACQCVKDAASKISSLKDDAAQQLPAKCKLQINVPISKTVDCGR